MIKSLSRISVAVAGFTVCLACGEQMPLKLVAPAFNGNSYGSCSTAVGRGWSRKKRSISRAASGPRGSV